MMSNTTSFFNVFLFFDVYLRPRSMHPGKQIVFSPVKHRSRFYPGHLVASADIVRALVSPAGLYLMEEVTQCVFSCDSYTCYIETKELCIIQNSLAATAAFRKTKHA